MTNIEKDIELVKELEKVLNLTDLNITLEIEEIKNKGRFIKVNYKGGGHQHIDITANSRLAIIKDVVEKISY